MMRSGIRTLLGAIALGTWIFLGACGEAIEIPNSPPEVEIQTLLAQEGTLEIFYQVSDLEGDDIAILIEVCRGTACQTPTPAPGGDGIASLPTLRDEPILHLFRWAAACDVPLSDFDEPRTLQITPRDEQTGTKVTSAPWTLTDLGVSGGTQACQQTSID